MEKAQRNNSIDIFRLICSIMVLMIHIHPFEEINSKIVFFLANIFPWIAVPFFFCVSEYYYNQIINSDNKYKIM